MTAPGGPPLARQTNQPPPLERKTTFNMSVEEVPPSTPPEQPPGNTYPCGCPWPGQHRADCMWSLWEQMRTNYLQTKELMNRFMTQVGGIQAGVGGTQAGVGGTQAGVGGAKCECPPECHGRDLAGALGLQQLQGVTVPWGRQGPTGYSVESEARKLMEEQRRIKNTWVQFLNIFDMALDLANDVSKDRWEANKQRKEQARLEREQRLEEQRRERRERCSAIAEEQQKRKEAKKERKPEKPKKEERPPKEVSTTDKKPAKDPEPEEEPQRPSGTSEPEKRQSEEAPDEPQTEEPATEEPQDEAVVPEGPDPDV